MADITKCSGDGCGIKKLCYRFTAKEGHWQSWFSESPIVDGRCSHVWLNLNYPFSDTNGGYWKMCGQDGVFEFNPEDMEASNPDSVIVDSEVVTAEEFSDMIDRFKTKLNWIKKI